MYEGLNFSDIFDDDIPYEQKPPEMLRPMEETTSNLEGRGFWLDPKGKFHRITDVGEWSHRDWAEAFFKLPHNEDIKNKLIALYNNSPSGPNTKGLYDMAYKYLRDNGYIVVVKKDDTIYFHYDVQPNKNQIRSLKNAAIENHLKLWDDSIQSDIELVETIEEDDFPTQAKNIFGGLWESDLLTETHLQDLYHATEPKALLGMLQSDSLKLTFAGGTAADEHYNRGYPYFLSTMRQKYGNFARGFGGPFGDDIPGHYDVVIHIDGNAVKNAGFKTTSINYWGGPDRSEQEERIISDMDEMKPLSKFVKDIHVYIGKDLAHPYTIDYLHQASKLAPERGVKIYFYPTGTKDYFRAHRHEKAVTDVSQILKPAQYSQDDLDYIATRKAHIEKYGDKNRTEELDAFLRIYNGDYSKTEDSRSYDERVMRMLRYWPQDIYPSLMNAIHNHKRSHLPVFRKIVAVMKKEGVKSFKDLITLVRERELKRLEAMRDIQEADQLLNEAELALRPGRRISSDWRDAHGIFIFYGKIIVAMKRLDTRYHFYSNDSDIEKSLNRPEFQQISKPRFEKPFDEYQYTHRRLSQYAQHAIEKKFKNLYVHLDRKGILSGRVWIYPESTIVGFWQDINDARENWNKVVWVLNKLDVDDVTKALYTFRNNHHRHYTYEDVMGKIQPPKVDSKELELQKLVHLNPTVKRGMLKLGSNRLQHYADKLGIPLIKLKHLLGSMDENNVDVE